MANCLATDTQPELLRKFTGVGDTQEIAHASTERCSTKDRRMEEGSVINDKALTRSVDLHVLPILFLIYVVAFLDRVNISNALTMGMPTELHLAGQQPNIALAVFFVPYIIFEIPSNLLMKRFNPSFWLSCCISIFGVVMLCQGFVTNYSGLLATRFFLGLAEAGIFPGSIYLISFWYSRAEAQKRFAFYYSSIILAGAFGGLVASGIAHMHDIRGISAWRWLFIIEGIISILVGIAAFFLVTDFPREAEWLSPEEKKYVLNKTNTDEARVEKLTQSDVGNFFKDPKNLLAGIMDFAVVTPVYAFAYFTPTIIKTGGYSVVQTQLYSVPPYAAAFVFCMVMAYASDKLRLRSPFVVLGYMLVIIGLIILLVLHATSNFQAAYAAICLVCMGCYLSGASVACWYMMNLRGHTERSLGSGWLICFGNTGGLVATFVFLPSDAPLYHTGYSICLAIATLGAAAAVMYAVLVFTQRRSNAGSTEETSNHTLSL